MPAAARLGDMVKQDAPHCHAPHGPAGPIPHPPMPLTIIEGNPNVLIGGAPAATVGAKTTPCMLGGCVPGGPGMIAAGSTKVLIGGKPAARVDDPSSHPSCSAPIPALTGKVLAPGCTNVEIGG